MGYGVESQENAEKNEGEEIVDGDGSDCSAVQEEMLYHLATFLEFVADRNRRDDLAYVDKSLDLVLTGT